MRETDKNDKTTMLRGKNILKIASFFSIFLMLFNITYFDLANAAVNAGKDIPPVEITDIELSDRTIIIKANSPLSYSLYKASDPFTTMLDIEGASLGKFTQKIFSQSLGVTEIRLSQITSPIPLARLEILLSEPSDVIPQMKDGSLTLRIKAEETPLKEAAAANSASKITAIKFEKTAESLEMTIKGNGNMPDPVVNETETSITLFIPNVKMATSLPEKIPAPIKDIKYNAEKEGLRFQVHFDSRIDSLAFAFADEVIIDIPYKAPPPKSQEIAKKEDVIEPFKAIASPNPQSPPQPDNAKLISLDFQDADVTAIIKLLADVSGKNIIIHPEVKGKTSMKLVNVPWEQALDVTLKSHNLVQIPEGNIIRVIPVKNLQEETKLIAELKDVQKRAEDQHTMVFTVNYVSVEKFKESLEKSRILTKDLGSVSVDTRTRTLTIKDTQSVLNEVKKVLESIDRPTKQVLIEARIVEISSNLTRSLGIEWGLKARPFNWETAIVGSAKGALPGGMGAPGLINLPAIAGTTEPTSAITFGYLNRNQTLGIDMRLSAIENAGRGRIISKPRVITGDNQKAKIVQGESIPYGERTTTGGTTEITTKFKDVAITIEVTPQITDDNNILLEVIVNKEDLRRFIDIGGGAIAPWTSKLEAKTNLMVENGETMVIGGIYKKDEKDSEDRVPGIASIPVVGELFKKRSKEDDIKEFIIFITPKTIVQR